MRIAHLKLTRMAIETADDVRKGHVLIVVVARPPGPENDRVGCSAKSTIS